jgi:Asp-tRNA(Asn)/Glu-tRNA(Gln) amidotransferase A subunit family amidase
MTSPPDGQMIRLYRDAGGIVFCKTNVPQVPLTFLFSLVYDITVI